MRLTAAKFMQQDLMLYPQSLSKETTHSSKPRTVSSPAYLLAAQASRQRIMDITVDNIKAFLAGNTVNRVNK